MKEPVSQEWINDYVGQLLETAKSLPEDSALHQALLRRAEYAMDLVTAWRVNQSITQRQQ